MSFILTTAATAPGALRMVTPNQIKKIIIIMIIIIGDSSFTDPTGEEEGCLEAGCCQSWCQCFMGFSFFR